MAWGTSQIWTQAFESLKNLSFIWLLVTKVYLAWTTKLQRSYPSWHWRVMLIWKKNWLVVWNRLFGKFSAEHLKVSKLGVWWDAFVQSRKVMILKFTEELCLMSLKSDAQFKGKVTCAFKNDVRNMANLHGLK